MPLNAAVKRFGPWAVLEYLVNPALALLTTPLIIKKLGVAEFGSWVVIVAIESFAVALTSGASTALARYIAANTAIRPDLTQRAQLDTFFVTSGASLLAALMAATVLHFNSNAQIDSGSFGWALLLIVMLTVMIDCIDTTFAAILRGELRYAASARAESMARIAQFGLILGVIYAAPSISGLAAATCGGSLVRSVLRYRSCDLSWITAGLLQRYRPRLDSPVLASVGWATVQNLGYTLYTSVDRLIISTAFGSTTLALYAVASQLTNQIQAILGAAFSVLVNATAQRDVTTDNRHLIRKCLQLTSIVAFGSIATYGIFFIFAWPLFSAWLGTTTSLQVLPLVLAVVIAAAVQTIVVPAHFFLLGIGRFKLVANLGLMAGILSLILLWVASKWFSPEYALVARAAYGLFLFSYFVVLIRATQTFHIETMRINSNRTFVSTLIAALLWRLLGYSQRSLYKHNLPRLLCLPSDFLGKHIICNGAFERETMEYVAGVLDVCTPKNASPSVFLDIGANIGNHTCFFAQRFSRTISAEPSEVVASILRSNVLLNGLQDKVTIVEAAISDRNGSALHYTSTGDNLGGSSLDDTRRDTLSTKGKEVQVITGDVMVSSAASVGELVSFVKIDVEGHEYAVIEGLVETLRRDHPVLLFEADSGPAAHKCLELLRQLGYCKFIEIIGDADVNATGIVRFARRMISGSRAIELREIVTPEPRYYEAILCLPQGVAHCVNKV